MTRSAESYRATGGEVFRFIFVGLGATLVYLAMNFLASLLGLSPYLANLAGYSSSVGVSYFGHSVFTFRSSQSHRVQGLKFLLVSGLTFALTNVIVFVMVDLLSHSLVAASLTVAASIPALSWLLARIWVFKAT